MRPMLAATANEEIIRRHLKNGVLFVSPKLDGIRGLVKDEVLVSRSLKPIRNGYVQSIIGQLAFEGLDGELICGDPTAEDCYRKSNSAFMSFEGKPNFTYYIFDRFDAPGGFLQRYRDLAFPLQYGAQQIVVLEHREVQSLKEVLEYEHDCLKKGYEGIILRHPDMPYKFNRSTTKEGGMLKLKRFQDSEARIVSVEELFHNANEPETNELGLTKRSTAKDGKVPMNTMGKLIVVDIHTGVEFKVGTGFTELQREDFWRGQISMIGTIVKYKYLSIGVKDKPRHPVYLGMRHPQDM